MVAPLLQGFTQGSRADAFGSTDNSYVGRKTYDKGINRLKVPVGATGYDESEWADTLQDASKCGFTIEYI